MCGCGSRPGRLDDRGQAGGIEVLPFGLLVFVVGVLIVANVWAVVDAKLATDAAAREATRQFVEAPVMEAGDADAAASAASAVGLEALAAHGRDPSRGSVELSSLEDVAGRGGFVRCARATFTASYRLPALTVPLIRGVGSGIEVRSRHSELVDPFRDGVPGEVPISDDGTCT